MRWGDYHRNRPGMALNASQWHATHASHDRQTGMVPTLAWHCGEMVWPHAEPPHVHLATTSHCAIGVGCSTA